MNEYQDVIDEWEYHRKKHRHCYYMESDDAGTADCPGMYSLSAWMELNGVYDYTEPVEEKLDYEDYMNYPDDDNPVKRYLEEYGAGLLQRAVEAPQKNEQVDGEGELDPRDFIIERLDTMIERLQRIEDALAERSEAGTVVVELGESTQNVVAATVEALIREYRNQGRYGREQIDKLRR